MVGNNMLQSFRANTGAFPWLSAKSTKDIKDKSKNISDNSFEQMLLQDDMYSVELTKKKHEDFMKDRQNWRMEMKEKAKDSKFEKEKNTNTSMDRMGILADIYRQYGYEHGKDRDSIPDDELVSRFNSKNPQAKKYADSFLTWNGESEYKLAQELWIVGTPWKKNAEEETWWEKAADVGVWVLQSPWKRWYNIVWQWIDRLGKRWAEQLEWSELQKWVQNKAVELFGEDAVKEYQQQMAEKEANWTEFNGREATDIRTPLLWEERANSKYTKAWEVVGDIASWIALTAPMSAALAPAMAWGSLWEAALLWAVEWWIDTLATQYGSQWNLDITPTQAILWIWGGALWWMLTNKLANLPKKELQDVRKEAESYIDKSIRPTVKGKQSQQAYEKFVDDTLDITDWMSKNKNVIQYTDDAGELVTWELPKNLNQARESMWNLKKYFYDQYNTIAKEAGDAGARVDLNKVFNELDDLIADPATNIANPWLKKVIEWYKDTLLQYTDDLWKISIEDAQSLTQNYNKILEAYFKNPWAYANDTSRNIIIAQMNRWVKDAIDDSMDEVLNAAINNGSKASDTYKYWKHLYGKVKTVEDELSKSALREMRKNTKWLSTDIVDALAGGEFAKSILTQDLGGSVQGAVMKWINSYNKYLNSPNTQLNKLFKLVDNINNWTTASPVMSAVGKVTKPNIVASTTTALKWEEDKE